VTSDGSLKLPGDAAFPGAYAESDPGLLFDIRKAGRAERLAYKAPGPAVWSEAAGGFIGSSQIKAKPTTTTQEPAVGGLVKLWGQCGGDNYHGPKTCVPGAACVFSPGASATPSLWLVLLTALSLKLCNTTADL
jgi:lytic cellulose monooxygenase (C1-hydroxylating)